MAPEVLYRVLFSTTKPQKAQIDSLKIRPALLNHYIRHRVSKCDYPAIIPDTGNACVRGTYVEGLTAAHVRRLDVFEGDQYERVQVQCQILLNDTPEENEALEGFVKAQTYVWAVGKDGLEEKEWDFAEFRKERLKWWVGGEEYAGELRSSFRGAWAILTIGRRRE